MGNFPIVIITLKGFNYAMKSIKFYLSIVITLISVGCEKQNTLYNFDSIGSCETYIKESESKFPLIENTEKKILFAFEDKRKTDISLVYFHGFSASRQELFPIVEELSRKLKANVFLTRFSGHGLPSDEMKNATVRNLINDAKEAMEIGKTIGNDVILIANSVGSTLALLVNNEYRDVIHANIFLSPCFALEDKRSELLTLPLGLGKLIAYISVGGDTYSFTPRNSLHEKYWTESYPTSALVEMMKTIKLSRDVKPETLSSPVQIIYNPNDDLIDKQFVVDFYKMVKSKNKEIHTLFSVNGHDMTGDIISPENTEKTIFLIEKFILDNL